MTNKPISDFLQQLIDEANTAIEKSQITIKEKLLSVYEQAKQEGFEPKEARKLMEEKITAVSDRYVRQVLPDEAKRTYTQIGTVPKLEEKQELQENNVNITTNHEIIDIERIPEPIPEVNTVDELDSLPNPKPVPKDQFIDWVAKTATKFRDLSKIDALYKINAVLKEENETLKNQLTNTEPDQPTTIEPHKASEDEQIKQFKLESDVDKYKKLAFDKQQQIEELEIKLERLTNQVNTQAEAIRQQNTAPTQDTPKIFPFTLPSRNKAEQCPKCHYQYDSLTTGRVFSLETWVPYVDNIEAQKQQAAKKWRNV